MSVQITRQLRTSLQAQADCLPDEHGTLSPSKLTKQYVGYIKGIEYIPYTFSYQVRKRIRVVYLGINFTGFRSTNLHHMS